MMMTTSKLIVLRVFNVSIGRFELFSNLLRTILLKIFIKKNSEKRYVASSKYFDIREID